MNTWKKSLPTRSLHLGLTLALILGTLCITVPSAARDVPFPSKHTVDANFDGAFGTHAADVDGDGDLDILAAANAVNDIAWWENVDLAGPGTGDGSAWTKDTIDGSFGGAFDVYAADVDGDGDLDVLGAAYSDNDIVWWENTAGDGSAWTEHTVDPTFDGAIGVHAADMDGDGDMDVLGAANVDDDITWWANANGAGTSWSQRTVDASFDGAYDVYAADMDGDGDMDVLGVATIADDIAWWENTNGVGTAWAEHSVEVAFDGASSVYAADVDGDGDLDVLGAANVASDVNWWENTGPCNGPGGACTTWGVRTVDGDFGGANSIYAADVDEDGDMDVLGAASGADDVTWWENTDGDGNTWTERTVDGDFDGANSVYAADVDGDGDLDVLSSTNVDDDVAWWENETIHRSATFPAAGEDIVGVDFENATSVYAADIDGDGDTDILGAGDSSPASDAISWWENMAGDGSVWVTRVVTTTWDGVRRIYAADMDGDGDLDVLGATYNDNDLAWFENDGTPTVGTWRFHWLGNSSGARDTYAADIDGDGDLDMLEASELAQDIAWWENMTGDGITWTKHVVEPVFGQACGVHAADLDRDGDLDILGTSYTQDDVLWWENTAGDGSSWTEYAVDDDFNGPYDVSTADVDGDGDLDVLAAGYVADDIVWWENDGTPTVGVWTEHTVDDNFNAPREVYAADVDGDGDMDVLSAAWSGDSITWWENVDLPAGPGTGNGLYWTEHTVAEFNGARGVHAADVDGDGDVDILGASYYEDAIGWWENRGGQFALATTDTAPACMKTGAIDDILEIEVAHRGGNGDSDLELATLELLFQGCYGAGCTLANLTSAQANELFDSLRVYKDTGSGVFESGTDILVANVTSLALTDGVQTVALSDGDPNVQVAYGTPQTFFVVVDRVESAPETPTIDRFTITHITESSSTAEDRSHDIGLTLEYTANVTSQPIAIQLLPVNSSNDPGDGFCDTSECTLREAINAAASGDTITFDPALAGVTITLGAEITLDKDLTIDGSGLSPHVRVSGGNSVRVFVVTEGMTVAIDHLDIYNGRSIDGNGGGGIDVFSSTLTISNTTFLGNRAYSGDGGAINVTGSTLFVTNSSFVGNRASVFLGSAGDGGAINNNLGTVTIYGSTFSGNISDESGGGISNNQGYVEITNSTFSGNSATTDGGGLLNSEGTLEIKNSTLSGNSAPTGGGIINDTGATLHLWNTIVADSPSGGDCINNGTIATNINNLIEDGTCSPAVTGDPLLGPLADNGGSTHTMALEDGSPAVDEGDNATCQATDQRGVARPIDGDGNGAAVCDIGAFERGAKISTTTGLTSAPNPSTYGQFVTLTATITAGGTPTGNVTFYNAGVSLGIGVLDGNGIATFTTSLLAVGTHPITATYDGDAYFHPSTSGVINQVVNAEANTPPVADAGDDQSVDTGALITLDGSGSSDPDGDLPLTYYWTQTGGPAVALNNPTIAGPAFIAPSTPTVLTFALVVTDSLGLPDPTPDEVVVTVLSDAVLLPVNSLNDPGDGTCDSSECTLREAVAIAASGDTITFDPALAGGTITLGSEIPLDKDLTIDGSSLSSHVQVSGGDSVRVFRVTEGVTVAIDHLDIRNGYADIGGGIDTFSCTLSISNTTFSGNSANDGGAINNNNATLFVTNSSFVDNEAAAYGGAINNYYGTVTVYGSTFSGNSSDQHGGGIFNNTGYVTVTNSTFYNNSAPLYGGGLFNYGDTGYESVMWLRNSTLSGNSAGSGGGGIVSSANGILHLLNTIVANSPSGGDCLSDGTMATNTRNLIEDGTCSPAVTGDPLLDPLADNGGPTETMALQIGSPAIDAGDDATCQATDQRGVSRPLGKHCDIGAYEAEVYYVYAPLVLR